ncbi:GNAT family N-acetyltransferase [Paenibacillus sepulcri]
MEQGVLIHQPAAHECPGWDEEQLKDLQNRMLSEMRHGGTAWGAFDGEPLVGFAVLGHKRRGERRDQLQVDLMYVSRSHRRRGIASRFMRLMEEQARAQGARYLYISATETESAVSFYQSLGSAPTEHIDDELFMLEPEDIHLLKSLYSE